MHRHINRSAAEALPKPLRDWMMVEVEWLSSHATDADKRKHSVEREAPRHYLDRDAPALACLDTLGPSPWFKRSAAACTEDTLWAYGVLPWQIQWSYDRLVKAYDAKDRTAILREAADLGHYVADAHVPLHTTLNYNGQLTGQDGIHAVWETRLPELHGGGYNLVVGNPEYITDVGLWAWNTVRESHADVDLVLSAERAVTQGWPGATHVRESRGGVMQLQREALWCRAYGDSLGGMVERRWRAAIHGVASLWYSAWVDAGQPDLGGVMGTRRPCGLRCWWKGLREREPRRQVP